jgi:hypothetical protein
MNSAYDHALLVYRERHPPRDPPTQPTISTSATTPVGLIAGWDRDECQIVLDGLLQSNRQAPPGAPDPALFLATGQEWIELIRDRLALLRSRISLLPAKLAQAA